MEKSIFRIDALNIDNVSISYIEWRSHLIGKKPSILFLHATGFHSRLWDQIATQLTGHHVIAPDFRGHGQSSKLSIDHWSILAQDISKLNILLKTFGFTYLNPHVYSDTVFFLGNFSKNFLINEKINFGLGAAIASFLFFFLIGYLSKYFSKFAENDKVWRIINTFIIIFMSLLTILIILDTFIS